MNPAGLALEALWIDAGGLRFRAPAAGPADGPLVLPLHGFPADAASRGASSGA